MGNTEQSKSKAKITKNVANWTMITTFLISSPLFAKQETTNIDPAESFNRGIFYFNKMIDGMYFKPTARAYDKGVPVPVRSTIGNFTSNVSEVPSFINSVLQGKPKVATKSLGRLVINTTLGLAGLFDIASQMGLEKQYEDFGQTLAVWGWRNSNYVVLPILGPSTVRDTVGLIGNYFITPSNYLHPKWRNRYTLMNLVHIRSNMKDVETVVGAAGIDYYTLVRSGYLQNREFQINDGVPAESSVDGTDFLGEPPA